MEVRASPPSGVQSPAGCWMEYPSSQWGRYFFQRAVHTIVSILKSLHSLHIKVLINSIVWSSDTSDVWMKDWIPPVILDIETQLPQVTTKGWNQPNPLRCAQAPWAAVSIGLESSKHWTTGQRRAVESNTIKTRSYRSKWKVCFHLIIAHFKTCIRIVILQTSQGLSSKRIFLSTDHTLRDT